MAGRVYTGRRQAGTLHFGARRCFWARIGDADDYHAHDDLQSIAEALCSADVRSAVRQRGCPGYGVCCREYKGNNYISLFWGEASRPDPVRDLTRQELSELNRLLKREIHEATGTSH